MASTDSLCTSFISAQVNKTCGNNNYLFTGEHVVLMNRMFNTTETSVYSSVRYINTAGFFNYQGLGVASYYEIHPVLFLGQDISLYGAGTLLNPYSIVPTSKTKVTLSVNSALSMQLSSQELSLNPIPNADLDKTDMTIRVDTNDIAGYKLVMSIAGGSSNTSLNYINPINKPDGVNYAISSIASAGDLATNTWGYNLGSKDTVTSFKPIPSYNTPDLLKSASGTVLNDTATVTFGGRVDDEIPAGSYQGTVGFSLVAGI